MTEQQGDVLSDAAPEVSVATALALVHRHWGIAGSAKPLVSERDHNFHIRAEGLGEVVLKIAHPAEPRAVTNFQTRALRHIALVDPMLSVPAVIPSIGGEDELDLAIDGGPARVVRLLTFLPGTLLKDAPTSAAQDHALGVFLARLGRALRGFFHPAAGGDGLLWDLRRLPEVRHWTALIADPARRALAERVSEWICADILPQLPSLRAQVVHNDFNSSNVVVGADPAVVAGAIDFGDMLHAPLVCDIATAAAYRDTPSEHVLAGLTRFAQGYHAVTRLEEEEIAILPALVACRLVLTVTIANWQAMRFPDKIDYLLRGTEELWTFLARLDELGEDAARATMLAALKGC